jgi:hypothetical protein
MTYTIQQIPLAFDYQETVWLRLAVANAPLFW